MANKIVLRLLAASFMLLLSSCSLGMHSSSGTSDRLPAGYTMANIESAVDECINYILWSNPNHHYSSNEISTPYRGQKVSAEVRAYTDYSGDRQVYAQSNVDIWNNALFQLVRLGGDVYCTGHTTPNQDSWPTGDYDVIIPFGYRCCRLEIPILELLQRKTV